MTNELRRKLRNIPGTAITFTNPPIIRIGGRGSRSSYQYTLQGLDLAELQQASDDLVQAMQDDPDLCRRQQRPGQGRRRRCRWRSTGPAPPRWA